ncbi:MAG TPA: SRPBCC family protein [Actinomycetota bacterium]
MPEAQGSVTIDRPVAEVFAFVADGTTATRWRPGVKDVELVSGQGLGAVYRQGVAGPGGRRIAADYRVSRFEPNRLIEFEAIAGPVRPTGSFRFEEAGGGTRMSFALQAEVTGVKKLVMGRAVQKSMDAEVAALGNLKRVLEA